MLLVNRLLTAHSLLDVVGGVTVMDMGHYDKCEAIPDGRYHFCDVHLTEDKPLIR